MPNPAPCLDVPSDVDGVRSLFESQAYLADRALATSVYLALRLPRPLLLEGEAGVGKTEVAKALAQALGTRLIRLQCYEGLDTAAALYEWNYPKQMLAIRSAGRAGKTGDSAMRAQDIYTEDFLIRRPLLEALEQDRPPVLLIDELDRADEPFEAFLLEILADYQVTIPDYKTVRTVQPPIVVLTSNRTRDVHDAVRRRCLYHWLDYPDAGREKDILTLKAPGAGAVLAGQVVAFVQALREGDLYKKPGISEVLDWAQALVELGAIELDYEAVDNTLGTLLKYQDDINRIQGDEARRLLQDITS